ncbi:MAG TPA: right-handed parallel beta-helix repeat-containing protein [Pyrinomonadaceae bacterium]
MKQAVRFAIRSKITALFCILTVLVGLTWIASGVNSQNAAAVEPENSVQIASAKAQGSETLKRYGALKVSASGDQSEAAGSPRAALAADFDADGFNDLLVAHNNRLVLHRGDINAFAPQTQEAWEAIRDGRFVSPFERKTRSTNVPAAADFILSGDFNRDARLDAAFAARGDNVLYVLLGDGTGNFPNMLRIETAGAITALASGDVNRADGLTDIIIGTRGAEGFALQVYSGLGDIFAAGSLLYNLPAQAEAIAVGQLNENEFADIAVGTDSEVIILSAKDSTQTNDQPILENLRLPQPAGVKSIVTGDLMPDRDNRTELGVLSPDGTIRIFARGSLDTRPVSVNEHLAEQVREYQEKGYPVPKRILERLTKEDLREPRLRPQGDLKNWSVAETVSAAAPNLQLSAQAVLATGRISGGAADDLIVLDQSGSKVLVMPFQSNHSQIDGENAQLSFEGKRAMQDFDADGAPVAALALKLNHDNDMDLLVLKEGSGEPSAFLSAPQATFTVTTAVDNIDSNLGDGVCNGPSGCTLRAAIMEANRLPGDDTIMINAGINPVISRGQPDNDGQGTNDQANGDLDITCVITNPNTGSCNLPYDTNQNDLSIIGAAGGNTVTAGTFTPYPINGGGSINTDRVFDVGQDGIFGGAFGGSTGVSATFTNLTITGGNTKEAMNTSLGGGNRPHGGGIRGDGFRSGGGHGSLTLTNTTVTNNQSAHHGGGISYVTGSFTASGSTFSNNIAHVGEGGGLFFGAATTASNVSITNSSFTSNEARRGTVYPGSNPGEQFTANADGGGMRINANPNTVTVNNTNFTNNIAQQDGGAIKTLDAFVTVTGGTMTGNTARRHGGVAYGDNDVAGNGAFQTFSGSTMRNNTANSDNTIFPGPSGQPQHSDFTAGDGGAVFRDRGTSNLTNCIIGGTGVNEPNTATNGGGVAHFFTIVSAAGNDSNQTIVNINGGSIIGNNASADGAPAGNNNGGGVYFNSFEFDTNTSILNIGQSTAVTINSNRAENSGGGIHVSNQARANLNNMTLRSNQANSDNAGGGDGGALFNDNAPSTTAFTGTLTIGGSGFANSGVNGGGIRNNAGTVNIPSGASITHNSASGTGGGISNAGTLSALATPTITNNTATGNGGGIFNTGTLGAITTPTLNFNSGATGGGIFSSNGALSITNGNVSGNTATTGKGGGIEHSGSSASTVTGVTISGNTGSGIHITGTGSLDAASNTIATNTGDGITKIGSGTGSHFNSNVIYTNGELGIDLSDNGVTPNDAGDGDTGPNNLQNFPVLNYVRRGTGTAGIASVTLNSAPGKYRIQYYANTACDASGFGEGEVLLAATEEITVPAGGTLTYLSSVALPYGTREQITATATSNPNGDANYDDGSTSEFSACRKVNTLPTFTAVQVPSRQQGSPASNSQIATVTDPDQTLNTLVVTVNGGASATVNGVTVSNIAVDASGNVTADVVASCNATNASFTLRVTDSATEFNETTFSVNVTPNTPPTLGNYPNTTVNAGSSGGVVTPDAAPTDNGTVATLTAAAPGFTGTFVGNTTTGTVTVNSAAPAGVYTVTVTATDNCGATSTKTFQLTVNAIPTITGATLSRQQGSPSANSQIATVNDADQSEETLVVTVNGGASATVNGVTVSNIAVDASGNVTADVVASCTATNATFTLTVTDSVGASSNATLTVNVTPNTPPTIGTYSATNLPSGGGTTVTPSPAPADNGSISGASATASGAFTGTLSVNSATGVVTISNANPGGSFTVSVTFTDNCGATSTQQFTLNVTYSISGTVSYGIIQVNQTQKKVPDVLLSVTGAPTVSDTTDSMGFYQLDGLTAGGNYTVTPTKTTDVNGISPSDATLILRHVAANGAGPNALSPDQQIAADTNGDGNITPFDATLILRYVVAMGPTANTGQVGTWKFVPPSTNYNPLSSSQSNQNYTAYLIGDVNGDWAPSNPLASNDEAGKQETAFVTNESSSSVPAEAPAFVRDRQEFISRSGKTKESTASQVQLLLPVNSSAPNGSVVLIPVWLNNDSNNRISSFKFAVRFDPNVLQPEQTAIEATDSLIGNGFTVVSDTATSGRLGIAATGLNNAVTDSGALVYLRFRVVGTINDSASALTFETTSQEGGTFEDNFGNKVSSSAVNGSFMPLDQKKSAKR